MSVRKTSIICLTEISHYQIFVTDSLILGAKVNRYIVCAPNIGIGTTVKLPNINDPEAYVNKKMNDRFDSVLTNEYEFLKLDRYNFIIRRTDIRKIYHDPTHKWGMGYYPDQGKIYIESVKTNENHKTRRELILVSRQYPNQILKLL